MTNDYVKRSAVIEKLGVHYQTVNNMVKRGELETKHLKGRKKLYNLGKYLRENDLEDKIGVCYCRVSSVKQKHDLNRQIKLMTKKYPDYTILKDIGSGLNFERSGLRQLLNMSIEGKIKEVVITYKDRLARIGYELIDWIIRDKSNVKITILNKNKTETKEEELVNDILTIMNVYVAKINGRRSGKNKENNK